VLVSGGLAGGWLVGGCGHARKPPREGTASFAMIEPTGGARGRVSGETTAPRVPSDTVIPAEPILPLATPVYPLAAYSKHTAPITVGVRVTIDAEGRVAEVRPSLRVFSSAGPLAPEFERAVEEALAQWRFRPAEARHLVPKTDSVGREYWQVTRAEKTTWSLDVAFTFAPGGDVLPADPRR
jgi:hypothetical protein